MSVYVPWFECQKSKKFLFIVTYITQSDDIILYAPTSIRLFGCSYIILSMIFFFLLHFAITNRSNVIILPPAHSHKLHTFFSLWFLFFVSFVMIFRLKDETKMKNANVFLCRSQSLSSEIYLFDKKKKRKKKKTKPSVHKRMDEFFFFFFSAIFS